MHDILSVPPAPVEELRHEVERLRLLQSICLEFSASLDFDELLPRVFHRVLCRWARKAGRCGSPRGRCSGAGSPEGARPRLVGAQMPVGTGFIGDVAQQPRTTMVIGR